MFCSELYQVDRFLHLKQAVHIARTQSLLHASKPVRSFSAVVVHAIVELTSPTTTKSGAYRKPDRFSYPFSGGG